MFLKFFFFESLFECFFKGKGVFEGVLEKVFLEKGFQKCLLSTKCCQKVFSKSVHQKSSRRVFSESVSEECVQRVS